MHRHFLKHAVWPLFCLLLISSAEAQRLTQDPDVLQSRIADQRVQRQTEIMRLERMIEEMDSRLIRLERQQMRAARLPAISVAEAEAVLDFAQAKLEASESLLDSGKVDPVQVASDRLALVRAEGQLNAAKAAQEESLLLMELDVVYAESQLMELRREKEVTQRLAAKGYTSSDRLQHLLMKEQLAEKELQLVKLRLQTQKKVAGHDAPPAAPEPGLTGDENSTGSANP
jgi:hypothetical protein